MLEVAQKCFGELFAREDVHQKLLEMIPTFRNKDKGEELEVSKFKKWSTSAEEILGLRKSPNI